MTSQSRTSSGNNAEYMREKGIKILEQVDEYSYANRFTVGSYKVELPNGEETIFFLRKGNPFSVIVPVQQDGSFVMVRQYRIGAEKFSLEFPMGEVAGKEPLDVARIELKEETGYSAGKIENIGHFYLSPGWSNQVGHVYLATDITPGAQELEPYEFIEVVVVTGQELEQYLEDGTIIDASTITAYAAYQRFMRKIPKR